MKGSIEKNPTEISSAENLAVQFLIGNTLTKGKGATEHGSTHTANLAIGWNPAETYPYVLNHLARFWGWKWHVKLTVQRVSL